MTFWRFLLAQAISLKLHIAFACVEVLVLFYFCILRQSHGAQGMAVDGRPFWMDSGSPGATSEVGAVAVGERSCPTSTSGSFRALATTQKCQRSATSRPQTQDESRHRTRDGSHEGVQTRESVGGDLRSPRGIGGSGGEAHQRAGHGAGEGTSFPGRGSGASREIGGQAIQVPRDFQHSPRVTSDCTPANGQFVAVRARCFGEGVDSSQVSCLGGSDHSPCCEETSGLTASIVFGRIPLMPCHVPNGRVLLRPISTWAIVFFST